MKSKIYELGRKIKQVIKLQDDLSLSLTAAFYFDEIEINTLELADAKKYDTKSLMDIFEYLDNCDKISCTIKGDNGYKKEWTIIANETDEAKDLKGITSSPKRVTRTGLGTINPAFEGLENNPSALGYLISKMENDRDSTKREGQIRQEHYVIEQEYKDKIAELKNKIEGKEREIREINEKFSQAKIRCVSYKKKFEELEKDKKSFDSTDQMRQIGEKVAGILMMTKEGGNADRNMLIGTALLGIAPQNQLAAANEPKEEEHEYYTSLKRLRLEEYSKDAFLMIYNLLRMVREKGLIFGKEILPIMIQNGYAKEANGTSTADENQEENGEEQDPTEE